MRACWKIFSVLLITAILSFSQTEQASAGCTADQFRRLFDAKFRTWTVEQMDEYCDRISGCRNLSGRWTQRLQDGRVSVWTLVRTQGAGDTYTATEQGLGAARGTARNAGQRIEIEWATGGHRGIYTWDLNAKCSGSSIEAGAVNQLKFTAGPLRGRTLSSTVTRN